MSTTTHSDRHPLPAAADTRVAPLGRTVTPLPSEFPFLRPPHVAGEIGRLGGYRVFKLLGAGGMGKVFLAEDVGLKRHVALKVMCLPIGEDLLSCRERFLREARAQAAIRHPNLVTVYQVGEDRGTVFLAMELLEGETLEARVRRAAPLGVPDVLRIAEDVARGLSAIHARGLIHRDIKPANIWLADRPADAPTAPTEPVDPLCFTEPEPVAAAPAIPPAKILDFGLVREIGADTHLTEVGAVVGTPAYMSPEQARGRPLDHRTDLFSLGCVLYAMATGRAPFAADTPMAQAAALAADEPTPVRRLNPAVPRALSNLVAELLAKDPDDRPASADEVSDRLRAIRTGPADESTAPHRPLADRGRREGVTFRPWHAVAGIALIGLAFAIAAAAVVSLTRAPAAPALAPPAPAGGEKEKAARPKPPPKPAVEYLADLTPVFEIKFLRPGRPVPPGMEGPLSVGGARSPRGILMHPAPPTDQPPQRTYALNGAYSRFETDVGFSDSAERQSCPVGFVVVVDDRPVWQSRPVYVGQPVEHCDIDVRGANSLMLTTVILGSEHKGAHAVWIDPRLTK